MVAVISFPSCQFWFILKLQSLSAGTSRLQAATALGVTSWQGRETLSGAAAPLAGVKPISNQESQLSILLSQYILLGLVGVFLIS